MPDRWSEFKGQFQAPACRRAAHRDCPHILGVGGGFNPRRLRPEFGAGLCGCSCHASCPVTSATTKRISVPLKSWYTSCTCPGADQERQLLDEAGIEIRSFSELRAEARRQSQIRTEAFDAARARSAGKSRDEIREIYVAELRARGQKIPAEPVLEALVDHITGNPLPVVGVLGESLFRMGKGLHDISRIFKPDR